MLTGYYLWCVCVCICVFFSHFRAIQFLSVYFDSRDYLAAGNCMIWKKKKNWRRKERKPKRRFYFLTMYCWLVVMDAFITLSFLCIHPSMLLIELILDLATKKIQTMSIPWTASSQWRRLNLFCMAKSSIKPLTQYFSISVFSSVFFFLLFLNKVVLTSWGSRLFHASKFMHTVWSVGEYKPLIKS